MADNNDDDLAAQLRRDGQGRSYPRVGPSDSSDTASEAPGQASESGSDRRNTGERAQVENTRDPAGADVEPDSVVPEDQAGLAHTRPDPVRNGG